MEKLKEKIEEILKDFDNDEEMETYQALDKIREVLLRQHNFQTHKDYWKFLKFKMDIKKEDIKTSQDARNKAIEYQSWASEQSLSYSEIAEYQSIFLEIAKEFNLEEEFKENGII
jgi:hypothetical protein